MRYLAILALALALPVLTLNQTTTALRTASASAGFKIDYPPSWQIRANFGWDGVMLANFPKSAGQEGVLIPRGAATISVFPTPTKAGSLMDIAKQQVRGDTAVLIRTARLRPVYPGGCTVAVESESLSEVGPGAFQQGTTYYCKINGKPIAIQLVNWRGDSQLSQYRRTLLQIAESLRPISPTPPR